MHAPKDPSMSAAEAPLAAVLQETRQVRQLLRECGDGLAEVNAGLKLDSDEARLTASVQAARRKNKAVEEKVAVVTEKVEEVESALNDEIRDRRMLDHQFAAALEQEAAARFLALHDGLTGLANRVLLMDRLQHEIAQAQRHGWQVGVMFIDLDEFKAINDRMGHAVGDRVLQLVAQRLQDNSRSVDTLSRFGGDEFVFVQTEVKDGGDVAKVAGNLLQALAAPAQQDEDGTPLPKDIRASIGIALFPQHGDTPEKLLVSADRAMYRAKQRGGGYAFAL